MEEQLRLFDLPEASNYDAPGKAQHAPIWYYIRHRRQDAMVCLDHNGDYVIVPHDTIHNTPHLFNDKRRAMYVARGFGVGWFVDKYLWEVR